MARRGWLVGAAVLVASLGCNALIGLDLGKPRVGGSGGKAGAGGATACTPGDKVACYSGPPATEGVSVCKGGAATCDAQGTAYGACVGEVAPGVERCATPGDEDCDGFDCVHWAELFGDEALQAATGVAVDASGGIYVVGNFQGAIPLPKPIGTIVSPSGNQAGFLISVDSQGTPTWARAISSAAAGNVVLRAVAADASGNVFVAGNTATNLTIGGKTVNAGAFVAAFSSSGQPLWQKGLTTDINECVLGPGVDTVSSLAVTSLGEVVVGGVFCASLDFGDGPIAGSAASPVPTSYGFVAKLRGSDGSGKLVDQGWAHGLCSTATPAPTLCNVSAVAVGPMDVIAVTGAFRSTMSFGKAADLTVDHADVFLAELSTDGSPVWAMHLDDSAQPATQAPPTGLALDASGGPTIAGQILGTVNFGGGNVVAPMTGLSYVTHYGADGSYKWASTFAHGRPEALAIDKMDNVFVVGRFDTGLDVGGPPVVGNQGPLDAFVAKLSSSAGALAWRKSYGSSGSVDAVAVALTPAAEPIVVGTTNAVVEFGTGLLTPAGKTDLFIAKFSQ